MPSISEKQIQLEIYDSKKQTVINLMRTVAPSLVDEIIEKLNNVSMGGSNVPDLDIIRFFHLNEITDVSEDIYNRVIIIQQLLEDIFYESSKG